MSLWVGSSARSTGRCSRPGQKHLLSPYPPKEAIWRPKLGWSRRARHRHKVGSLLVVPGVQKYFQAQLDHQSWEGQTPSKQPSSIPAVSCNNPLNSTSAPLENPVPSLFQVMLPQPPTVPFPVLFPSLPPAVLWENTQGMEKLSAHRSPFSEWQAAPTLARSTLQWASTLRPAAQATQAQLSRCQGSLQGLLLPHLPAHQPSTHQSQPQVL